MTAQVYSFQTFGLKSFLNILNSMVKNAKDNVSQVIFNSAILEVEKAEKEILSLYYYISGADNEELAKYDFDNIIDTLEDNSSKIENILKLLKDKKDKPAYLQKLYEKLNDFYTALVQCKIELSFINAEIDYETNKAS